jgi:hypothetical protein
MDRGIRVRFVLLAVLVAGCASTRSGGAGGGNGSGAGTTPAPGIPVEGPPVDPACISTREAVVASAQGGDAPEALESAMQAWALEVGRLVESRTAGIISCYERRLDQDFTVRGSATLTFLVGGGGKVRQAGASIADAGEGELEKCFARVVCGWTFPPSPSGGEEIVERDVELTGRPVPPPAPP